MKPWDLLTIWFLFLNLSVATPTYSQAKEKISFCRPNNMVAALAFIAEKENYFSAEGLDVEYSVATNAKICQDLLVAGKADFMLGADGPFTYLSASNPEIKILAFVEQNPETAIFARKDSGINSIQDLVGKKVAYLPGTISYLYLARVLNHFNIKKSDLSLTSMQPPSMPPALVGKAVDAFVMWEPWGANALKQLGDNGIKFSNPEIYQYESLLTARSSVLKDRPEVVLKVLRALFKAEEFINNNKEKAIDDLIQAIAFDRSVLSNLWSGYHHKIRLENGPINLMVDNFKILQRDDENFKSLPIPDYKSFIDDSFLKQIAPDRVTLDNTEEAPATTAQNAEINFCRFPSMISALSHIAERKHFFEDEKLTVKFQDVVNGKICQDELVAGHTDFINVANGPFTYISASNPPIKIIAILQDAHGQSLFTRDDTGINSFADMKGKRIGYLPGTLSALMVFTVAEKFGLKTSDILLTSLQPPAMISALVGNQIDGIVIWEPWGSNALDLLGEHGKKISGREVFEYQSFLVTTDSLAKNKPEITARVLRALIKAEKFLKTNESESKEILATDAKFGDAAIQRAWEDFKHHISLSSHAISLLAQNFALLRKYDQNFADQKTPDFRSLFDPAPLLAVDKSRVEQGF